MIETLVLLVAAGLAGGLPLLKQWSSHGLHVLASVSAGVLLGTVFLHLLPELTHELALDGRDGRLTWVVGLIGFLLLFFVEKVWLAPSHADSHQLVWLASYTGLCVHAAVAGLALAAVVGDSSAQAVGAPVLVAIVVHKVGESFSLATVMRLAGLGAARMGLLLGLFALVTPVGVLIGQAWSGGGPSATVVEGFACGTFLYVAACDLLPEVFHGESGRWLQGIAVVAGAAAVGVAELL